MLQKSLLITAILCGLCLGVYPSVSVAQTPQEFVKEFYEWYFATANYPGLMEEKKIHECVDAELIEHIEKFDGYGNVIYFTQMGDYYNGYDSITVEANNSIAMAADVHIVHVAFINKIQTVNILVHVKHTNGNYKIINISNIYPYS